MVPSQLDPFANLGNVIDGVNVWNDGLAGIGAAWKVAEVTPGSTVAIFGLGAVGLAVSIAVPFFPLFVILPLSSPNALNAGLRPTIMVKNIGGHIFDFFFFGCNICFSNVVCIDRYKTDVGVSNRF